MRPNISPFYTFHNLNISEWCSSFPCNYGSHLNASIPVTITPLTQGDLTRSDEMLPHFGCTMICKRLNQPFVLHLLFAFALHRFNAIANFQQLVRISIKLSWNLSVLVLSSCAVSNCTIIVVLFWWFRQRSLRPSSVLYYWGLGDVTADSTLQGQWN